MPTINKIQTTVDETQGKVNETIDSAQEKAQEVVDKVQEKTEEITTRVEGGVKKVINKIKYSIDWVQAAVETSGFNPSNLFNIAKVLIGREVVANPIVVPVLPFSLVAIQITKRPSIDELKQVIESAMD